MAVTIIFFKFPAPGGQGIRKAQALALADWLKENKSIEHPAGIPIGVQHWPDTSWKKTATAWLVRNGFYWCYPRQGFSTTGSEKGTHQKAEEQALQSPMSMQTEGFRWQSCATSMARYDAYMEWQPPQLLNIPGLSHSVDWDLHGMKRRVDLTHEQVVTRRQVSHAKQSWGRSLKPPEINIFQNIPGVFSSFAMPKTLKQRYPILREIRQIGIITW
jgi:hypothetical protein